MRGSFLAFTLCALAATGCDDGPSYAGLSFDVISAPPVPVMITSDSVRLVEGIAVKVTVTPLSHGDHFSKKTRISLNAKDPTLVSIFASEAPREFVFVGARSGESCLEVSVGGELEECIPLSVRPAER